MENMRQGIIAFVNIKIKKRKLHRPKNVTLLADIDIDNILISSLVCPDEKMMTAKTNHWHNASKKRALK